jgi:hypothetical protein
MLLIHVLRKSIYSPITTILIVTTTFHIAGETLVVMSAFVGLSEGGEMVLASRAHFKAAMAGPPELATSIPLVHLLWP